MKRIYKVTQDQLTALQNGGTVTVGGVKYSYETGSDVAYVVVDPSSPEYRLSQNDDNEIELLKDNTVVSNLSIAYSDRSGYSTYSHTLVYPDTYSPEYVFSLKDGGTLSGIKDTGMESPNYIINFPQKGGTVALDTDVSAALSTAKTYADDAIKNIDYSGFVTVGGSQDITGAKSFKGDVQFYDAPIIYGPNENDGSLTVQGTDGKTVYLPTGIDVSSDHIISFPSQEGTLALVSDISGALGDVTLKPGVITTIYGLAHVGGERPAAGHSMLCGNGLIFANPAIDTDQGWIRVTGTGENDTCLEIATGDDGETDFNIHFRGYSTDNTNTVMNDIVLPKDSGTVALTKNIPTKVSDLPNDAGYLTSHQDISGKYDKSDIGYGTMKVTRNSSVSTSSIGYWAAMCNSTQTGSPTLPSNEVWWHVISMDWGSNIPTEWYSQLALPTQQGGVPHYRRNDAGGTSIDSSTWHKFITDENIGSQSVLYAASALCATADGAGNNISDTYARKKTAVSSSTTGITASASGTAVKMNAHGHGITQTAHSHSFTPSGKVGVSTADDTTGSSGTGITASSSAPKFTGSSHTHTFTGSSHSHRYDKTTGASFKGSTVTSGGASANGVSLSYDDSAATGGSSDCVTSSTNNVVSAAIYDASTYTLSFSRMSVVSKVSGKSHTHSYSKATGGSVAAHTHSVTAEGSISLTYNNGGEQVTTIGTDQIAYVTSTTQGGSISGTTATGSISGTTQGGSVSAPTITITDNGHTHSYVKPTGSGTFTGTSGTTGTANASISIDSATSTTASVTNPAITITDNGHTHTQN